MKREPDVIEESWNLHLQVVWGREPKNAGWKRRVGHSLRRLADQIDGRRSWAVTLETMPALSMESVHDCFKQGAIAIEKAATVECRLEAQERVLQRVSPRVYSQ